MDEGSGSQGTDLSSVDICLYAIILLLCKYGACKNIQKITVFGGGGVKQVSAHAWETETLNELIATLSGAPVSHRAAEWVHQIPQSLLTRWWAA